MLQYNKNLLHIKKAAGYTPPTPPIPDPSYYVIGDFTGGGAPSGWSVGGSGGNVGYGGGGVYSTNGSPVTLKKSNMPSLENAYMVEIVVNCSIKSMTDTLTIALRTGTTDNYTGTKGTNGTSPQLRSFFRDGSITSNTSGTLIKGRQSVKATIILEDKDELLQGSTLSNMGVNLSHSFSNITNAMNYVRNSDNLYVTFSGETIVNSIDMYVYVRQPTPPTPVSDDYFCITAAENGSVALNKYGTPTDVDIEISSDKTSWSDYTFGDGISLNTGEKIYFRNKSETQTGFSTRTPNYVGSLEGGNMYYFTSTNNIYATGDVNSLLCRDPSVVTTLSNYCFTGLFWENTKLLSFEKLPSTHLGDWCYCGMFEGCTALTYTPTLPATTVGFNTYASMFRNCTSLTIAPALPATTLGMYCYFFMFGGCTSLTRASTLSATTLNNGCYQGMFYGCTALTTAPSLPATTLAASCYYYMFDGCTALTTAPSLPATTLVDYCYYHMFAGCTALTTAPSLPATTLAASCYYRMFYNCESLVTAPSLPATTLANDCYNEMFAYCASLVNAPTLPATTLATACYCRMFHNCASLTTAPSLPATGLATYCYDGMFRECASLVNAPALPATTLTDSCYSNMFYDCISLVNAPALPATTLADYCYAYMFNGCTTLTTAPDLPATTLANYCYDSMFDGCTNIKLSETQTGEYQISYRIPTTGTGVEGTNSCADMFTNTGGTFTGTPSINTTYYLSNGLVPPTPTEDYLCFTSNYTNSNVALKIYGSPTTVNLETSTDGITWSDYNIGHIINLSNIGDKVYFRNKSETVTRFSTGVANYYYFSMAGQINASGDINYLLCKNSTTTLESNYYCFYKLFTSCANLITPPKLTALITSSNCYEDMFYRCEGLTTPPQISATFIDSSSCEQMFQSCTSLNAIPQITADIIGDKGCSEMFIGCSNIKISTTQTGDYINQYVIPNPRILGTNAFSYMFLDTGGTFTGTPTANTTYYTSNQVI